MQYDTNDVMCIEVPRDRPFAMSDHLPLVAGGLPDGRQLYNFALVAKDGLVYAGSGPTPEEARFLQRNPDRKFIFVSPSLSEMLRIWVLRYGLDAYMHCEYYVDKMRTEDVGRDPTGPFFWGFERYLPAFYPARDDVDADIDGKDSGDDGSISGISEQDGESICDEDEADEVSLCTKDEDWKTAEEGSMLSGDISYHV